MAIHAFAPDGTHIDVGRPGAGPNEFRGIRVALFATDTLFVFDGGLRRVQVLGPQHTSARTLPLAAVDIVTAAILNDSLFALAATFYSRERAGLPLHLFHRRTGIQQSFGETGSGSWPPQAPWLHSRAIAAAHNGTLWSARQNTYEIERWSVSGEREVVLRRPTDWFKPWVERAPDGEPSHPWITGIHELTPQLLAVFTVVPARDFARRLGPPTVRSNEKIFDYSRSKFLYDTMIEIIDTEARMVVYRAQIDEAISGVVKGVPTGDRVILYASDTIDGVPYTQLLSLTFNFSKK